MTRRRNTAAAAVFAAVILVGSGASAQGLGLEALDGMWMGDIHGNIIESDALEMEMHLHGDHVDGHWHIPMPEALMPLFPGEEELGGRISGGHGTPPVLEFEVELLDCEVEVTVTDDDSWTQNSWEGTWHTHGCPQPDEGDLHVMRAGAVPALPLVGVLLLAAILARRGWRGLQDRR